MLTEAVIFDMAGVLLPSPLSLFIGIICKYYIIFIYNHTQTKSCIRKCLYICVALHTLCNVL